MANYLKLSDSTLKEKTGKDWSGWIAIIDGFGGATMDHKEIAAKLLDNDSRLSGWWAQSITVGYEYAKGRRVLGQTKDAGFEIGVQKTLPIPTSELWQFLISPAGLKFWLGDVPTFKLKPGNEYQTADNTTGEIRTVDPGKRIRLTWQPEGWPKPTTVQLYLLASGHGTALRFHHEKLADQNQRAIMRSHWRDVLKRLAKSVSP